MVVARLSGGEIMWPILTRATTPRIDKLHIL